MKAEIKKIKGTYVIVVPKDYISEIKNARYVDIELSEWRDDKEGETDAS